jgi:hypothetical protein|tara:strand:- start:635 stop:844 length:210 start_codon:yes stop_codon:yes gene_type:complete
METTSSTTTEQNQPEEQPPVKLVEVAVADENVALNLLVSFVSLAQKRGAFNFEESSKIWECIKKFQKKD